MIGKILAAILICAGMAAAQSTSSPVASVATAATATPYAFEVVSIRRDGSEAQGDFGGPSADGYRMTNSSLALVINTAYVPLTPGSAFYSPGQIKGLPGWANTETYDIDARISEEVHAAWQNHAEQKIMLRSMLQSMLVQRCKLAVHREVKEAPVYSLVVGNSGIKFKETDPTAEPPSGQKLPWGGVLVSSREAMRMYGASMASLASLLSNIVSGMGQFDATVQDKTGLTGRYDFVIKFPPIEPPGQADAQSSLPASDPSSVAFIAAAALGLKLEKSRGQVETLVIDHIERPSEN